LSQCRTVGTEPPRQIIFPSMSPASGARALLPLLCLGSALHVPLHSESLPPMKVVGAGTDRRNCIAGARPKKASTGGNADIVGGTVCNDPNKYPFLAWVGDKQGDFFSQICGGTLISERIVLTAGHCLYEDAEANRQLFIRLNVTDFAQEEGILRSVVSWRRHSDYDRKNMHNDIALMLLNASVPVEQVRPVRLSDGKGTFEKSGSKRIVGWGSTDDGCTAYDTQLREAEVPMGEYGEQCQTPGSKVLDKKKEFNVERQVCAGKYVKMDSEYPGCGDSGGPLLAEEDADWVQMAIVSWSYGSPWPDVFTRVSAYRDWIEETSQQLLQEGEK